jgi:carbon storage regulator
MLVLTRKPGEQVVINGNIIITIVEARSGRVHLGIEAPTDVSIIRPDAINKRVKE